MVDLRIFKDRNYATGTGLIFFTCVLLYGIGLLTPEFLQLLMGYTSFTAGVATCPLGLGAMVSMVLVGIFVARIDPRAITVLGFLTFGLAGFMLSRISLAIDPWSVFWPQILAGLAIGFLFVPVSVMATAPLRRDQIGSATGFMSLMRNVGGSVGIAVVSTFLVRRAQTHQTYLVEHINPTNPILQQTARGLQQYFHLQLGNCGSGAAQAMERSTASCSSRPPCSPSPTYIPAWESPLSSPSSLCFSSVKSKSTQPISRIDA